MRSETEARKHMKRRRKRRREKAAKAGDAAGEEAAAAPAADDSEAITAADELEPLQVGSQASRPEFIINKAGFAVRAFSVWPPPCGAKLIAFTANTDLKP
jgi:hypothetical protein